VSEKFAKQLKSDLGKGTIENESRKSASDADITIIIGSDY
jgi:hypothetical protein